MTSFTTEEEWQAAFEAAFIALSRAVWRGDISLPDLRVGGDYIKALKNVARDVATDVITSTARLEVSGDITELPGVQTEHVELEAKEKG